MTALAFAGGQRIILALSTERSGPWWSRPRDADRVSRPFPYQQPTHPPFLDWEPNRL